VERETEEAELSRLVREQSRTRQDEVFGGLTSDERAAYDKREKRLHELRRRIFRRDRLLRRTWVA
jgi:hypothetical protein